MGHDHLRGYKYRSELGRRSRGRSQRLGRGRRDLALAIVNKRDAANFRAIANMSMLLDRTRARTHCAQAQALINTGRNIMILDYTSKTVYTS